MTNDVDASRWDGLKGGIGVIIFTTFLSCALCFLRSFRCRRRGTRLVLSEQEVMEGEAALMQIVNGILTRDAIARAGAGVGSIGLGMTETERRDKVSSVLISRKVVASSGSSSAEKTDGLDQKKGDLIVTEHVEGDFPACAICLEEYCIGEEICWSRDNQCDHVFHRRCILEWLVSKNPMGIGFRHECPCCRRDFLALSNGSNEDVASDGRDHSAEVPFRIVPISAGLNQRNGLGNATSRESNSGFILVSNDSLAWRGSPMFVFRNQQSGNSPSLNEHGSMNITDVATGLNSPPQS